MRSTSKTRLLPLGLICFLVLFDGSLAQQLSWKPKQSPRLSGRADCRFQNIIAREPNRRQVSEAGFTEFWDAGDGDELQCAGVQVVRHTINPKGLLLPYYPNTPELVYVVRGQGIQGTVIPGCQETFETSFTAEGGRERFTDRHQKVYRYKEGDILALPAGAVHWTYNDGDKPTVVVALRDTSNVANQLDRNFKKFFLAGNPQSQVQQGEPWGHPGQSEWFKGQPGQTKWFKGPGQPEWFKPQPGTPGWQQTQPGQAEWQPQPGTPGWKQPQPGQAEWKQPRPGQPEWRQTQPGTPEWRHTQPGTPEWKQTQPGTPGWKQPQPGQAEWKQPQPGQAGWKQPQPGQAGWKQPQPGQTGWKQPQHGQTGWKQPQPGQTGWQHPQQVGEGFNMFAGFNDEILQEIFDIENEIVRQLKGLFDDRGLIVLAENFHVLVPEEQEQFSQRVDNNVDQPICTTQLSANIGKPAFADVYNPRGGRISSLNSHKLPVLESFQLSAERGLLYKNVVLAPHYNLNAHSIIYITSGNSRLQIVGNDGSRVFDDVVNAGQLIVVPQNFAVIKKAGEEGCEWVAFKTNDNAITTQLAGRFSYIRSLPEEVLVNSYNISPQEAKNLKYNRKEGVVLSPRSTSPIKKASNVVLNALFG